MKLLNVLNLVHEKLLKAINSINNDILSQITPWQNYMLINIELEERIRRYISLVGIIFLVLVIVLGMIPVVFFNFIIIYRLCNQNKNEYTGNDPNRIQMNDIMVGSDISSMNGYPNNQSYYQTKTINKNISTNHHRQRNKVERMSSNNGSSGILLCLIHIAFVIMIIILVIMVLLTGVYYALDLVVQGACRTVHDDQPFLINFIIDRLIKSNIMPYYSSEINRTVTDVISDCRNHIHFSKKIFENYWSVLDGNVKNMMNTLSEQIFNQFIKSIGQINIPLDINLIIQLINQANRSDVSVIAKEINKNLITMNNLFKNISNLNSILSPNLIQSTISQFENYVKKVLESTLDGCPLPLAMIYKTDTLVCHTLGSSLSGLCNMFNHNDSRQANEAIYERQPHHHLSWTHELIARAAGFAAMKTYEDNVRNTGEQVSYPLMKEMLADIAAAEIDKLFETQALGFLDREQAKRRAIQQAHQFAYEKYRPGGIFNVQEGQYEGHYHQHHHHYEE
ncbi:unnamed protein product [Rotaria sordida]|uniref:Uncharacterized protein n=1 Tax=Rotaria sordida TaxID=392033 RepID=A0A814SL08_9BILA|nr:unnamed protein product [Rotaria sordida]